MDTLTKLLTWLIATFIVICTVFVGLVLKYGLIILAIYFIYRIGCYVIGG